MTVASPSRNTDAPVLVERLSSPAPPLPPPVVVVPQHYRPVFYRPAFRLLPVCRPVFLPPPTGTMIVAYPPPFHQPPPGTLPVVGVNYPPPHLHQPPPRTLPDYRPPLRRQDAAKTKIEIRSVWAHNLDDEFALIRAAIAGYPYVTLDTEFPLVGHKSNKNYRKQTVGDRYNLLKANVDENNLTQLGLTFSTATGQLPFGYVWEFNFRDFNIKRERHNPTSLALLKREKIDLEKFKPQAIDYSRFAELVMSSGLVCNRSRVSWTGFGCCYDFGFLTKLLTGGQPLPETPEEFFGLVKDLFGTRVYDIKHLMANCGVDDRLGLEQLAATLGVKRVAGRSHKAGSDSLLTRHVFQKMQKEMLEDGWEQAHSGVISGLQVV